ncbi:MAG: xylulokinase [Planctomycetia bacterium]|nr:xylulokinase [Planctomycetia bacterium]
MPYLLAHDLGTSGNKAVLYDSCGNLIKSRTHSYPLFISNGNWAEQRAEDWWEAVCLTTRELLEGINPAEIAAVSFSGQMMGCLCVDEKGTPLRNAMIWADLRSTKEEQFVRSQIEEERFYKITGHRISPAYGGFKFLWLKNNEPDIYRKTFKTLNAKDFILFRLTGNFLTEFSDASSLCLMDLNQFEWSDEILEICGLDKKKMPELRRSIDLAGYVSREAAAQTGLLEGTPVVCGGGDGSCAAVGAGCVKKGIANCVLGTSSWISITNPTPIFDPEMTTFNFAHIVPGCVMPTGTMQCGGGSLSWVAQTLNAEYEEIRTSVRETSPGAKGLIFLPYLIGERSPRWDADARGAFIGLTLEHGRGEMVRAVLEGVAMNLDVVLNVFRRYESIDELVAIGGGARNDVWLQIFADVFNARMIKPNYLEEATSMGAAITAGVGVGLFDSFDVVDIFLKRDEEFVPNAQHAVFYEQIKPIFDECYHNLKGTFGAISRASSNTSR